MQTWPHAPAKLYECIIPRVTVRHNASLKSGIVAFLTVGIVVKTTGRRYGKRVEIEHPIEGWISLRNGKDYACVWPLDAKPQEGIAPVLKHMDAKGAVSAIKSGTMNDYCASKTNTGLEAKEYQHQLLRYFEKGCDVEITDSRREVWRRAEFHSFQNSYLIATIPHADGGSFEINTLYSCSLSTIRRPVSEDIFDVLNELISTEEEYINNLENIDLIFFEDCDLPDIGNLRKKLNIIQNLIRGHNGFRVNLKAAHLNIYSLCQIFEDKAGFFQYYHQYYEVYFSIIDEYLELVRTKESVKDHFDSKPQSFEICVLRPVKRPSSYQEFLKKLRKKTEYDFERFLLDHALKKFTQMLHQLNEKQRDMEAKIQTEKTVKRIKGFHHGDLFAGGRREFFDEFVCTMKRLFTTEFCKLYVTSDSLIITDSGFWLKHHIPYQKITSVEQIPDSGIELTYTIHRRESMSFMEKMASAESRSVSFFGDKDDYWFKMIQRNWHGSLETFRMASDRRRGMNNILYESGGEDYMSDDKSRSVSPDDPKTMNFGNDGVKFEETDSPTRNRLVLIPARSRRPTLDDVISKADTPVVRLRKLSENSEDSSDSDVVQRV